MLNHGSRYPSQQIVWISDHVGDMEIEHIVYLLRKIISIKSPLWVRNEQTNKILPPMAASRNQRSSQDGRMYVMYIFLVYSEGQKQVKKFSDILSITACFILQLGFLSSTRDHPRK